MNIESFPQRNEDSNEKRERRESELRLTLRTKAALLLTKIARALVPEAILSTEDVDMLSLRGDEIYEDLPGENETGIGQKERDRAISSLQSKLDKAGFGLAQSNDANAYEITDAGTVVIRELLNPWNYQPNGSLDILVNIDQLKRKISRIKNLVDKEAALQYLTDFSQLVENEKIESPQRYIENLREPNWDALNRFSERLNGIDASLIASVESITTEVEALSHPGRAQLRELYPSLHEEWEALYRHTRLQIDRDKSRYPEFWSEQSRLYRIYNAIGAINKGVLRHDLV